MKTIYDAESDALSVRFSDSPVIESEEVSDGVVIGGQPSVIRAFRKSPKPDNKTLRVAYTIDEDGFKIITAFFDRGRSSPG